MDSNVRFYVPYESMLMVKLRCPKCNLLSDVPCRNACGTFICTNHSGCINRRIPFYTGKDGVIKTGHNPICAISF